MLHGAGGQSLSGRAGAALLLARSPRDVFAARFKVNPRLVPLN